MPTLYIVGRFPPPVDGQSMATQRLAGLLDGTYDVETINLSLAGDEHLHRNAPFSIQRSASSLRCRKRLRKALARNPLSPVIWTSISSQPWGHLRDLITILPSFPQEQPVFAVVHRGDFDKLFTRRATRLTGKALLKRLQGLIFLNATLAARCAPWVPASKRHMIPNTVDADILCSPQQVEESRQQRIKQKGIHLLFLSNMIPSKGFLDVVSAVRLLHAQEVDVRLTLLGAWNSATDERSFRKMVRAHGTEHIIHHYGATTDRSQIQQLYLDAHAFLLPTYYAAEAQPLTIIEAMNSGVPIITTTQGGISKMIRDKQDGLFVPRKSPESIAAAVRELCLSEKWHEYSTNVRQRFEHVFSPTAVRKQWLDLLAPYQE